MTKVRKILTEDRGTAKHLFKEFGVMITQIYETIEDAGISINEIPPAYKHQADEYMKDLRRAAGQIEKACDRIVEIIAKAE
jgi:hypothetical protein